MSKTLSAQEQVIIELRKNLASLGWNEETPRVKTWLEKSARKKGLPYYRSIYAVPLPTLRKLTRILAAIINCSISIQNLKWTWEKDVVVSYFKKWEVGGEYGKMCLKGWVELENRLSEERDFKETIPF